MLEALVFCPWKLWYWVPVFGFLLVTELAWIPCALTRGNYCWLASALARICLRVSFDGISFIGLLP